jgi:hypothetical protein
MRLGFVAAALLAAGWFQRRQRQRSRTLAMCLRVSLASFLVFCGSPRRYEPRYFRSPSMRGVKENSPCTSYENGVAQAPDGLFLSCVSANGETRWVRGDA